MAQAGHLCLDEVISSAPELGPTLPDGGFSWIVLAGAMGIQMTVPTIISIYGVVLGQLILDSPFGLDSWEHEIALTPILFTAFLCLADPWSRIIIHLASVPRLVSVIGVCLLAVGVVASGYLATGGVGAYLASSSAGAVMGIGGSFILVQTESVLRRNFRMRLRLALVLKEVATALGFILAPGFALALFSRSSLHIGLLLMACCFIPAAVGALVLRSPSTRCRMSPYTPLISEEDNELSHRARLNRTEATQDDNSRNVVSPLGISPGNDVYNYQDPDDDHEIFNAANHRIQIFSGLGQKCQVLKTVKFWVGVVAFVACRTGNLFLWILLPSLATVQLGSVSLEDGVSASVVAGLGTLIPNIASYWKPRTARWRSFCFGSASWLGSLIFLALCIEVPIGLYLVLAFLGGVSTGGASVCLDSALCDAMGSQSLKKSHTILSTIVGLSILSFAFIGSPLLCLRLTAGIQFISGSYWILVPMLGFIRAR